MRVGRTEARRLCPSSAASATAAGSRGLRPRERQLAGIHEALEHRLGLVGLAELLEAQRLIVGLNAACRARKAAAGSATPSHAGLRRGRGRLVPGLSSLGTVA